MIVRIALIVNILEHIRTVEGRPLQIATKKAAIRDLKRVGRNLHLLNEEDDDE